MSARTQKPCSHFLFSTPDKTKYSLSQLTAPMHLLLGCLLTSLFKAHPSLLGDKCHLPPPSTATLSSSWQMSRIHEYSVHRQALTLLTQLWSSFQKKVLSVPLPERLCVTLSAFAVVTSLFECSNRRVTRSWSGLTVKGVRATLPTRMRGDSLSDHYDPMNTTGSIPKENTCLSSKEIIVKIKVKAFFSLIITVPFI